MNVTPAMQQYYDIKSQYQDCILFFRMGDFYEMFENDAEIAHKILGITLTSRNKNAENPVALAGIPYHAKEKYLPLLVNAGYKVAIAEQVSDPKLKGIVQREVIRVVTPATLSLEGDTYIDNESSTILLSFVKQEERFAFSMLDIGKNIWTCSEFENFETCKSQIYKLFPKEVILEKNFFGTPEIEEVFQKKYGLNIYYYQNQNEAYALLCKHFGVKNLQGFGLEGKKAAQKAAGLLLEYISSHQKSSFSFLNTIRFEAFSPFLELDEFTIRSLDLVYNFSTKSKTQGTLFGSLDATQTFMGKRYLQKQILEPLQNIDSITERQKFIQAFKDDTILLERVRKHLGNICDLEILFARLSLDRATPKDLLNLKKALLSLQEIQKIIHESNIPFLNHFL